MTKRISIFGSTGSIGCYTLDLISQHYDKYEIITLAANQNIKLLAKQAIKFRVSNVVICDPSKFQELKCLLSGYDVKIFAGYNDMLSLAGLKYDIVVIGISGIVALKPIMEAIDHASILGIANKESIVCGGDFIMSKIKNSLTTIIPLDSEHNAIFQVLEERNRDKVEKVMITASGGPFLQKSIHELKDISPKEAIRHPKWKMGNKISVDSSNMMNKGLEVIEACKLFDLDIDQVDAIIHPESIVHGMVYYTDGSILAQMGYHDMRTPISTILEYPKRSVFDYKSLDFIKIQSLNFQSISRERFPLFYIAKESYKLGSYALITLSIANEVAVSAFLNHRISFLKIDQIVQDSIYQTKKVNILAFEDVLEFAKEVEIKTKEKI